MASEMRRADENARARGRLRAANGNREDEDRAQVVRNLFSALTEPCGMQGPSPSWWINFRVIDDGNWGSRGAVLSFLDLLSDDESVFPPERAAAIRTALAVKYDRQGEFPSR